MKQTEHNLQTECVKWFRLQYPQIKDLLFAIPNGGQRNKIVAAKLKAEGVVAGVPDLFLAVPEHDRDLGYVNFGLFIEMKIKPNKPTPNQQKMMDVFRDNGYQCVVCYSFDEFRKIVQAYLK